VLRTILLKMRRFSASRVNQFQPPESMFPSAS
jgi:hypothetical protein